MLRHCTTQDTNDRLAHLAKDATRALPCVRCRCGLPSTAVSFGHWTFLRILWETDGLTQRELSVQVGVMEPTTFAAVKPRSIGLFRASADANNKEKRARLPDCRGRALKEKLVPLAEEVNEISVRG